MKSLTLVIEVDPSLHVDFGKFLLKLAKLRELPFRQNFTGEKPPNTCLQEQGNKRRRGGDGKGLRVPTSKKGKGNDRGRWVKGEGEKRGLGGDGPWAGGCCSKVLGG